MKENPDTLLPTSSPKCVEQAPIAPPSKPRNKSNHCYHIGIIGSKSSGKTCLLAALSMARSPNTHGYTCTKIAAHDPNDIGSWIDRASDLLNEGQWPPATPLEHQHATARFLFTDGLTRQKEVEMEDYSGELLNPAVAQADLAKRLREMLQKMDGLVVLAEHPLPGHDSGDVEKALNGLLGVFALLNVGQGGSQESVARQIPIAMIVNKWDRSPHYDASQEREGEDQLCLEKFLASKPPPFHTTVENVLRPAAGGRFKSFPVSAVGAVRREGSCDQASELPPAKGTLKSLGVEAPFLWVIQQRDEIDVTEQEQSLTRRLNWLRLPNPSSLRHRDFSLVASRFASSTPEAARMLRVKHKSWAQASRQLLVYVAVFLVLEGLWDGLGHRNAEECIKNPTIENGWQIGTAWLIEYARSTQFGHMLYSTLVLTKQSALKSAIQVVESKDEEAFNGIPKLTPNGNPVEEGRLKDAERMAISQKSAFPNSRYDQARQVVIDKVKRIRSDQAFEKQLSLWKQKLDLCRPITSESIDKLQSKLKSLNDLINEISSANLVPLDGYYRDNWKNLSLEAVLGREDLVKLMEGTGLHSRIRLAMDAPDYLKAADLLASPEFQNSPKLELLNEFQMNLDDKVKQKVESLSVQGENWKAAVDYATMFLDPARRSVLSDGLKESITNTIANEKIKGDRYLYDLAQKNKNTVALDAYAQGAPLKSMALEINSYIQWLQLRAVPRELTFRLVEIKWANGMEKGWTGSTKLKLFVNQGNDNRNAVPDNNPREGITQDRVGIRIIGVKAAQTEMVTINFQTWHIPRFGAEQELSNLKKDVTPENLNTQPRIIDNAGNEISITADGVIPEPSLPVWHDRQ